MSLLFSSFFLYISMGLWVTVGFFPDINNSSVFLFANVFGLTDSVFFGSGDILSCRSSTCALCFLSFTDCIWLKEQKVARSAPPESDPSLFMIVHIDACVLSHQNPDAARVPSHLSVSGLSSSFLTHIILTELQGLESLCLIHIMNWPRNRLAAMAEAEKPTESDVLLSRNIDSSLCLWCVIEDHLLQTSKISAKQRNRSSCRGKNHVCVSCLLCIWPSVWQWP